MPHQKAGAHRQGAGKRQAKARAAWERGRALLAQERTEAAADAFELAVQLSPDDDLYRMNAARACMRCGRDAQAEAHARRAVELDADNMLARALHVTTLDRLQRFDQIAAVLSNVPEERRTPEIWTARAEALVRLGRHQEAIADFMQALSLRMDDAQVHFSMSLSFYELGLKEEAAECILTAQALGLQRYELHLQSLLAYCERENCRWDRAAPALQAMRETVAQADPQAEMVSCMFAHTTLVDDPLHQLQAARLHANSTRQLPQVARSPRVRAPGERIRLGYVSADFHAHATCILLVEVLEQRDTTQFEVFLYSHGRDDRSEMRARVRRACDHFVDLAGQSDQAIAERIAADGIDILVDLKGYTGQNRFGVFPRRPAPLQVSYLGYPGTTGADCLDYIIGDPVVTPLAHAAHFSEHIAQMPLCYQPNDGQRARPGHATRAEHGLPENALVLCGFNQAYKISPEVLDVWCDLMHELPGSVLWLLDWHGQARPNLLREIECRGIAAHRIHWAGRKSPADHITRLQLADIFLDTWPTNAHTTASDALWAGVPLVTFQGQAFVSRVAASLLQAVGLGELACTSVTAYRQCVLDLARDASRRQRLRDTLAQARDTSPLFDGRRYARDFEALLLRMQARQDAGLAPAALAALPPDADCAAP